MLCDNGFGKNFLHETPKAQKKKKVDKLYFMKILKFCASQNTLKSTETT